MARPRALDSPLVARLRAAGCVVVGKTNTPELGWKADTDNVTFGPTSNPWNLDYSPGGSSGGSAAAIASGMVPLATGSDGGGSIRIPSSCCGAEWHQAVARTGAVGGRARLGLARAVDEGAHGAGASADVVTALDVAVGPDPSDIRSLPRPEASWPAALEGAQLPSKVAWSPTLGYAPLDDEVRALCEERGGQARVARDRGGRDRGRVRRGPGAGLAHVGGRLQLADIGAVPGHRGMGTRSTRCWPRRWTGPPSTCPPSTSCRPTTRATA